MEEGGEGREDAEKHDGDEELADDEYDYGDVSDYDELVCLCAPSLYVCMCMHIYMHVSGCVMFARVC